MFIHINHDLPRLPRETASDGTRVYKTPSGAAYPSVTTVTGLHKKKAIMEWRKRVGEEEANKISSRASSRGTRVHTLCEDYLSNKQVEPDMFDHEMWEIFKPYLDRINNIHALEAPLYSDHLQVAGTVDCIAEWDGKLSIIDFKTARKPKQKEWISDYFMQCAAYAVAFEERTDIPVPRTVILMAVDDHEPMVFEEKRDNYIQDFISLREQYRKWQNR